MPLESLGEALFLELKSLLLELSRMDITEFELEYRGMRILVRKNGNGNSNGLRKSLPVPVPVTPVQEPVVSPNADFLSISSPLTGIFYLSPSPTAKVFVEVGDVVKEGQVVGLVEAMKVFNEIKAEVSGRVARIHVKSGELVRAGQTLMELSPLS